ncbi:titin homolog [Orussus abietinus]|uniref:titin homolog n=1 Tax=Orussus abietinus TaxID=222816 RepID=UPI000625B99D|nr:titin homolog [Orussus abietinus]XP_012286333.1 titin homolog [Orussus abietinus]
MWSRGKVLEFFGKELSDVHNTYTKVKASFKNEEEELFNFLESLVSQIPESRAGPLIAKTPRAKRKKGNLKIDTIPENYATSYDNDFTLTSVDTEPHTTEVKNVIIEKILTGRAKREASRKAADNIKKQQSLTLTTKLRRPSSEEEQNARINKANQETRTKRPKAILSSSDEEEVQRPMKHSKVNGKLQKRSSERNTENQSDKVDNEEALPNVKKGKPLTNKRKYEDTNINSPSSSRSSLIRFKEPTLKKMNVMNESLERTNTNETVDASIYEDAIGKSGPVMNSTMNYSNTIGTFDKKMMMNVTVVLDPLPMHGNINNETVVLEKNSFQRPVTRSRSKNKSSQSSTLIQEKAAMELASSPESVTNGGTLAPQSESLRPTIFKNTEELITDDESSPERTSPRKKTLQRKQNLDGSRKRLALSNSSSEEDSEIESTPAKAVLQEVNLCKPNKTFVKTALFSPYAKDSVKKKVEAFEQATSSHVSQGMILEEPARITRTKSKALAAAAAGENSAAGSAMNIAQKLARKSLAKAKKISLAKQIKTTKESKENNIQQSAQKISKLLANEKSSQKQQLKTTPLSKIRQMVPMSVNRFNTPATGIVTPQNVNVLKSMTASRTNIVSNVDSFLQSVKAPTKQNSRELSEERSRNEEDVRRKRAEALRLQIEEKKRKREEKELKNKLAREAKEKLAIERRLKLEKEREEKARLALQLQEKQKEEAERKRLVQLQRLQEKEDRRKQEEQLRLQRLQEQEDAERLLAEQRQKEQEIEKRKLAEAKAQHNEANRLKAQMSAMQTKTKQTAVAEKKHEYVPNVYHLDSEPDDDESDDESQPKHPIPIWAKSHVRESRLIMQQSLPLCAVLKYFNSRMCTPDLTQLFPGISKNRLKRTSSAVWKTLPRFSMMENDLDDE